MFVQTEITPNPNSLKFLPGRKVSNSGPYEVTKKDDIQNELVRNILSVNGVEGVFLGADFISINKEETIKWEDIKHIAISLINEFIDALSKDVLKKKKSNKRFSLVLTGGRSPRNPYLKLANLKLIGQI